MSLLRINHRPSGRQLLVFALAWLIFAGALGWAQWAKARPTAALVCWGLALAIPAGGVVWREGLRRIYLGMTYAAYPLGFVVSAVVLTAIYYAVLTPIGLILRVCGHDPLQRHTRRARADSHWYRRPGPRGPAGYFRQY